MGDRFDEMAKAALDGAMCHCHEGYTSRLKVDPSCVWCNYKDSVREELVNCWNDAIEAAARQYDGTAHEAFARAIRELKEPKR